MKLEEENDAEDNEPTSSIAGDVIGDTAYSERFVLNILLKLANLDTLKEELKEKSFEEDLCTLWDMTAEKDVVLFLLKHDILKLFCFALPVVESKRILEIGIGIIANMCCHREAVIDFMKNYYLLSLIFQNLQCDDILVLIQMLRLVSSCLFLADDDDLDDWMSIFDNVRYAKCLYYIMKNSSNKDLLVAALENFNTVCSYCNVEKLRPSFFYQFVTMEALDSVSTAFNELTITQKDMCGKDETERILVITLQLAMNLVGFDKSPEIYNENRENVVGMINQILSYYETKFVDQKEIDTDLVDIIESTNTVINMLEVSEISAPDQFFMPSYNMWKALVTVAKGEKNTEPEPEEEKEEDEVKTLSKRMITPLSVLMCTYMAHCSDENLRQVLDDIGKDYEQIIEAINDKKLKELIVNRAANYRTRLKDNVDA